MNDRNKICLYRLYVLRTKDTKDVFYIGCTTATIEKRLKQHYKEAYDIEDKRYNTKKNNTIRNIGKKNIQIILIVSLEMTKDDALNLEEICISYARRYRHKLTNTRLYTHFISDTDYSKLAYMVEPLEYILRKKW